jgi:hypothetical protein
MISIDNKGIYIKVFKDKKFIAAFTNYNDALVFKTLKEKQK